MEYAGSTRFSMSRFLTSNEQRMETIVAFITSIVLIPVSIYCFVRRKNKLVLGLFFGSLGLIPVFALGGYQAIEAVDASSFCTKTCHTVHYPEAVTYEVSPHSEVTCAKCHVGEGTSNLVISKLKGLKEIVPTITDNYHKPIATPLQDRRPSSQTCETCHWSDKFFGDKPLIKTSYAADTNNTRSQFTLVLKVDGGLPEVASGIHWHATSKVWYLPADDQRKEIIWVATEDAAGNVTEYVDPNRVGDITPELIQSKKRQMDCVDCHNRVTHLFRSPDELIDAALTDGSVDVTLPFIKQQGLAALVPQNKNLTEANAKVDAIVEFYKKTYPDLSENQTRGLIKSIAKLKEIAKLTTFSDGLDWNTHPDNAVHDKPDVEWQIDWAALASQDKSSGCFRCHGNLLKVDSLGQQLTIAQSLNGNNIAQFVKRVNLTLADLPGDKNTTIVITNAGNQTNNQTAGTPAGAYGHNGLKADCNTCHYTRQDGTGITPLAPAVPHPTDGLDNCLVCHSPGAARPFKQTHPWATNDACRSCHQTAPKLKSLPSALPSEAPAIPHSTARLDSCLSCHAPTAVKPFPPGHPWSTEATCTACHKTATALKPLPQAKPVVAKEIPHATTGLENCLSCHGQPTVMPFTTGHPWGVDTCATCHKQATTINPLPQPKPIVAKPIAHVTTGFENCLSCHGQKMVMPFKTAHPWTTNEVCSICHKTVMAPAPGTSPALPPAPLISHSITGLYACAACHNSSGLAPFPATHAGRPESFCLICHKPGATVTQPPQSLPTGPAIPHSTAGLPGCTACHQSGGPAPFSATHVGRPESFCPICHQPAGLLTVPASPGGLTAAAISAGQVNLTWVDNSADETGFRIERATDNTYTTGLVTIATTTANAISYSDTTVSGSTTYYYRIYAVNQAGSSVVSNTASVITPVSSVLPPVAASGLTAAAISAGQVNLSWVDNSADETGFRIERAADSVFSANLIAINVAANTLNYSDTTVSGNTAYYYRVYAFNQGGNSVASNVASVTTPAAAIDVPALYAGNCAACHGATRLGGSASALTSAALANRTLAQVTATINNGVGSMPAYSTRLSSAQIAALAQWLKGSPPVAASGLTAAAISAGQVNLSWIDNSADETGFRIERATDNVFTANLISINVAANIVSYSDTTVSGNTTYYYRIYAYSPVGDSVASNVASATTPVSAVLPPAAASGLTSVAISAGQVNLTWVDNANSETGFRIERATNNAFTTGLVTLTSTAANVVSYSDTTVSGNTIYYYRVYAFNQGGASLVSNVASVTTPAPVIDPAALYAGSCASCHGASRQGGSGPAVTSTALATRTLAQITATLTTGTMSSYTSTFSSAQIAALAQWLKGSPPVAASGLTAAAISAGQVNLSWVDNSADETGFRIERATNNAFTSNLISINTTANISSYSDTTVSGNITYYYRVYSFNAVGTSAVSNTASAMTPVSLLLPPAAASGLTATVVSAGQVNLAWVDNAISETGFRIERATNNVFTVNLTTVNLAANAVNYSDTTVSGSTTYYYRVYAFNAGGTSAASNVASASTPVPAIDAAALYSGSCASCHGAARQGGSAPALTSTALASRTLAQITATLTTGTMSGYTSTFSSTQIAAIAQWLKGSPPVAPGGLTATVVSAGQVNLSWVDNSADETGFRLERATNNAFTTGLVTVAMTAANAVSYSDTTVTGNTTYYYRAYAFSTAGNSAASNPASVSTPVSLVLPPAAASGLTVVAANYSQVNLTWVDNANSETGFRIERATDSTFVTNLIGVNVAANIVSYRDTTVSGNTTYYYRVYAFNQGGNSAVSNVVSVTTPAAPPPVVTPQILHTTVGYTDCLACHLPSLGIRPYPASHVGRTVSTCLTCHVASGSTTTPFISVARWITSHTLDTAHQNCLSCHGSGRPNQFPGSHNGRTNITCLVCHRTR